MRGSTSGTRTKGGCILSRMRSRRSLHSDVQHDESRPDGGDGERRKGERAGRGRGCRSVDGCSS